MKTKLATLFFILFLIPIYFSSAQIYTPQLGSPSNPIYIQVEQNPMTLWSDAWDKLNTIQKVPYCSKVYDDVMAMADKNGYGDLSFPGEAKSKARYLNYLYSYYQTCMKAYLNLPKVEKTEGQRCQSDYGVNSMWSGTYNAQGGLFCSCKTGYEWNSQRTSCEVGVSKKETSEKDLKQTISSLSAQIDSLSQTTPTKSNNQLCGETFTNSTWKGNKNTQGGLECDCDNGYEWNGDRTSCVLMSNVVQTVSGGGGGGNSGSKISNKDEIIPDIKVVENIKVSESDVKKVDKKGSLIKPTALRKCPSITCEIIRYYAETSELNIVEENISGEWYKIKTENNTGWVIGSSFDKNSIIYKSLPKLDFATTSLSPKPEPQVPKSIWQRFRSFFGLWIKNE
jgi:hypothetical protein